MMRVCNVCMYVIKLAFLRYVYVRVFENLVCQALKRVSYLVSVYVCACVFVYVYVCMLCTSV